MITNNRHSAPQTALFEGVDRIAILVYVLLVICGLISITSACYDETIEGGFFTFAHSHVKQALWACGAMVVGIFILLLDSRYYHMYAYYAYAIGVLLIIGTIILPEALAPTINGAKAWYDVGPFNVQPVEFTKITVALAMARVMSNYSFSISNTRHLMRVGMIILLPLAIIILQNDTGSGVVLCSFLFVLYREGLNKWICIPILMAATLFIFSFLFTPLFLLILLVVIFTLSNAMMTGNLKAHIVFIGLVCGSALLLYGISALLLNDPLEGYTCMVIASLGGVVAAVAYAFRHNIPAMIITIGIFIGSMIFVPTADKIFESVLKPHQKERILSFLGIVSDPSGVDYNVNQSKIAIGSGGIIGKGLLQGTQSKYFVPEKQTDFIFCTVGEEWGFVGSVIVLGLLCTLILRLMKMGERSQEPFCRIYNYCVASILLFHAMVNVGMTIGLIPVMGIPLPFISYGGSSLVAFTILVFIAIRLDATPRKGLMNA